MNYNSLSFSSNMQDANVVIQTFPTVMKKEWVSAENAVAHI